MKKIICRIYLENGKSREVNAYEAAPGLAVYKNDRTGSWHVTHISSGLSATPTKLEKQKALNSREEAVRWAKCLAEVFDFTSSARLIENSITRDIMDSIIKLFRSGYCPGEETECPRVVLRTRK